MTRSLFLEVKYEFLKLWRTPSYFVPTLFFPLMFYMLFGVVLARQKAAMSFMSSYLLATYGAGGVIGAMMFGFAVGLAVERGMGWLQLKYASPMRPAVYLVAKGIVCVVFGAVAVGLLFTVGALFGGVRMPFEQWLALGGTLVLGAIPFAAMALAIGYFAGASAAPGIVSLIYMPMCFLSGLWIPFQMFPRALQDLAPALPAYHFGQLALAVLGRSNNGAIANHIAALASFTLLFAAIAWIGHRREKRAM